MEKNERKALFLIFLLIVFLRIPTFYQPVFDIDETFFSEIAKTIAQGNIPYIDAADNKSPLMFYLMAGIYWLTGSTSLIVIHIVNVLILILTAFLLYKAGKMLKNSTAGILAAFIFAILAHIYEPKNVSANIETFLNLFFAAIAYFYLKSWKYPNKLYLNALITGLLTGFAILTSFQAIFVPLIILVFECLTFFLSSEKPMLRLALKKITSLAIGAVFVFIPIAMALFYFYKIGALDGIKFWIIEHNARYAAIGKLTISYFTTFFRLGLFILCSFPAWAAAFLFFKKLSPKVFLESKKRNLSLDSKLYFFLLLSLIAYVYIIILGKRSYGHYFLLLLVPLALSGALYFADGISFNSMAQKFSEILKPIRKWVLTFLVFAVIFSIPRTSLPCMYEVIDSSFGKADKEYSLAADYLKSKLPQNTPVLAWGFSTPIYYYSGMSSSTRFLSADTLTGRLSVPDAMPREEVVKLIDENVQKKLWDWFWEDLQKRPPIYIIDTSPANYYGYGRFAMDDYPDLKKYRDRYYCLETEIHKFKIYRRKKING